MAKVKTVWGVDVGQCALKAVKLIDVDGQFQVESFEVIEHEVGLSSPDVDARAVVEATLEEFLRRVDVSGAKVAVSVLGQSGFTRFVKLPPVEKKKIPDIVRFEAEQQIPFPLEEVIWRYQTFSDPDSPEVEVGIFAMKQADVSEMLSHFVSAELDVDVVQMSPLALYNFMVYDGQVAQGGATMLADVGADKTHLVVADGGRIWTRTVQIGGNNFTQALVKSFKLSFAKAEKLKRTAASSKYARQIFQVMRPVFAELVQEIQRSIGYYTSLHRDSRFKQLVGIGNGFRLPGMQKYLEQNLNMPVTQVESFARLSSADSRFQENALSFGVAYGLAIQAMEESTIQTNLLPQALVRKRLWAAKKSWFSAAAAVLVLAAGIFVFRSYADLSQLKSVQLKKDLSNAQSIAGRLMQWKIESRKIDTNIEEKKDEIARNLSLRAYSKTWPTINSQLAESLLDTMLAVGGKAQAQKEILQVFPTANAEKQEALARQISSDQGIFELIGMLPYNRPGEKPAEKPDAGVAKEKATDGAEATAAEPPEATPPQETLRDKLIATLTGKSRSARQIIVLEGLTSQYVDNLGPKEQPKTEPQPSRRGRSRRSRKPEPKPEELRGFEITLSGRTSLPRAMARQRIGELKAKLQEVLDAHGDFKVIGSIAQSYDSDQTQAKPAAARQPGRRAVGVPGLMPAGPMGVQPGRARAGDAAQEQVVLMPDPLFPTESMADDIRFQLTIKLAVTGDGITKPADNDKGETR